MRAVAKLTVVALCLSGCTGHEVVRIVDGVPVEGRFVNASAYAAYIEAADREARGDVPGALVAYRSVTERDPGSVLPWVRVGALRCAQGEVRDAREAFGEAEERAPRFEPLWRARAECALAAGDAPSALAAARRAVAERPRRVETVLLLVDALRKSDQSDEAFRYLVSLAVQHPNHRGVWEAIRDATDDPVWVARAEMRLDALVARAELDDATKPLDLTHDTGDWAEVDRALRRGELDAARRAMRRARLDHRLLAARALLIGEAELALREAGLRLSANPDESDARVAFALAADLTADDAALSDALGPLPSRPESLSPSGQILMAELLARRVGPDAAAAWTDGPADLASIRRRLAEALAAAR